MDESEIVDYILCAFETLDTKRRIKMTFDRVVEQCKIMSHGQPDPALLPITKNP